MSEHALVIKFKYGQTDLGPMYGLEDELEKAIKVSGAGEFDGHEITMDGSDGTFYLYGPDADKLFVVAEPILKKSPFMLGATAVKRYGPPADDVRTVTLIVGA